MRVIYDRIGDFVTGYEMSIHHQYHTCNIESPKSETVRPSLRGTAL